MFQTDICFPKHLFLTLTGWQNQCYPDLLDQWGLCLANPNVCLKTLYKTCACLTLHNRYLSYEMTLCFTKQGICIYKTEPNRASNKALVYVFLSLYVVMSQPCSGMTKNHIFSKVFPEIIDFSRKLKESRTNLTVSKLFKNSSNSKKKSCIIKTFPKNFIKSHKCL